MDNIEFFNRTTAALFKLLLDRFPRPILKFDTESFRKRTDLPRLTSEDDEEDVGSVIEWLGREGFIHYTGKAGWGHVYTGMVLTAKGLAALNRVPDALTPKITVADRLRELSREASKEVVTSLVKIAITGAAS